MLYKMIYKNASHSKLYIFLNTEHIHYWWEMEGTDQPVVFIPPDQNFSLK